MAVNKNIASEDTALFNSSGAALDGLDQVYQSTAEFEAFFKNDLMLSKIPTGTIIRVAETETNIVNGQEVNKNKIVLKWYNGTGWEYVDNGFVKGGGFKSVDEGYELCLITNSGTKHTFTFGLADGTNNGMMSKVHVRDLEAQKIRIENIEKNAIGVTSDSNKVSLTYNGKSVDIPMATSKNAGVLTGNMVSMIGAVVEEHPDLMADIKSMKVTINGLSHIDGNIFGGVYCDSSNDPEFIKSEFDESDSMYGKPIWYLYGEDLHHLKAYCWSGTEDDGVWLISDEVLDLTDYDSINSTVERHEDWLTDKKFVEHTSTNSYAEGFVVKEDGGLVNIAIGDQPSTVMRTRIYDSLFDGEMFKITINKSFTAAGYMVVAFWNGGTASDPEGFMSGAGYKTSAATVKNYSFYVTAPKGAKYMTVTDGTVEAVVKESAIANIKDEIANIKLSGDGALLTVAEDGFFVIDENSNIGFSVTKDGIMPTADSVLEKRVKALEDKIGKLNFIVEDY